LLSIDEDKDKAMQAQKMASGANPQGQHHRQQVPQMQQGGLGNDGGGDGDGDENDGHEGVKSEGNDRFVYQI